MHELLLFGQIPGSRHDQVLNILAGVTASQPTAYTEQHLIYAPRKAEATSTNSKKRPQQPANQQLYYHDVYRDEADTSTVLLRINQEPEPGNQHVISRSYTIQELTDTKRYDDDAIFKYIGQQIHKGHHFIQGNVVLRVYQLYLPARPIDKPIHSDFPETSYFKLFDESGAYIIDASIRMEERGNSKLIDAATKELLEMKRLLQGAIELSVPDRLALDTRVKAIPANA